MTLESNDEYIPRDDESEAGRLADPSGVGEIIYHDPDDVGMHNLNDFGMHLPGLDRR